MKPLRAILEVALVVAATTALEFAAPSINRIVAPVLALVVGLDFWRAQRGRWLFYAAIAIVPFPELQSSVLGPLQLHHVFALLALVAALVDWWKSPRPRRHLLPRPSVRLVAYYVVLVGVTLVHVRQVASWHRLEILVFLFVLALLATHYLRTRDHLRELLYVVGATAVGTVLLGLGAFYLAALTRTYFDNPYIHISTTEGVPRLAGTLLDSNFLGMHLLLVLPACLAWLLTRRTLKPQHRRDWLGYGLSVLLLAAFLLTYSRSAYVGLAAAVVALLVVLKPQRWLRRLLAVAALVVVAASILYPPFIFYTIYRTPNVLVPTAVKERLIHVFDPRALVDEYRQRVLNDPSLSDEERDQLLARDVSSDSLGYRLIFWRAGLAMFRDNPAVGVGVGQFRYRFASYATITFLREPDTHNIYIEQLAETGVVGFAFFVWIFGSALRDLWRIRRGNLPAAITFATLIGILAQSTLLGGFGAMPLFLTLGVAGAITSWQPKPSNQP